jgi:tRNA(Arg) A34 adenosine deaminase TadA
MTDHVAYIRQCYALADEAVAHGNHPFGALLVLDGRVVATACNDAVISGNPTRHAEMMLLAESLASVPLQARSRAVLYTSTEPCVMCAGAIYWSGISTVVFGCSAAALATVAGGEFLVPCRETFARGKRAIAVTGPVLESEGLARHRTFWRRDGSA